MAEIINTSPTPAVPPPNNVLSLSFSTTGNNTLVAAVTGKKIVIYGITINLASSNTLQLNSGSTALTGVMTGTAFNFGGPWQGGQDAPAFACAVGDALVATLGSGVQASGVLHYSVI